MLKDSEYDDEPVFYCTKCLSLNVMNGKKGVLYCGCCGAGPKYLDVTHIHKYMALYRKRTGHSPLEEPVGKYDDLKEVYDEEATIEITPTEALTQGLKVRDVINKRWDD